MLVFSTDKEKYAVGENAQISSHPVQEDALYFYRKWFESSTNLWAKTQKEKPKLPFRLRLLWLQMCILILRCYNHTLQPKMICQNVWNCAHWSSWQKNHFNPKLVMPDVLRPEQICYKSEWTIEKQWPTPLPLLMKDYWFNLFQSQMPWDSFMFEKLWA
jgi:hypothetical protein